MLMAAVRDVYQSAMDVFLGGLEAVDAVDLGVDSEAKITAGKATHIRIRAHVECRRGIWY